MTAPYRALTLGVYPTARGFGWVAFEGPFAPYDWGLCSLNRGGKPQKNERCLKRLGRILERLKPEALVLESFDATSAIRSPRIQRLCKSLIALAADRGIEVAVYSRKDIASTFRPLGVQTRDEIAEAVARHIPAFRYQLPNKRKKWESEDKRLALFNAAALVLTHYAYGASRLFEDLRQAT